METADSASAMGEVCMPGGYGTAWTGAVLLCDGHRGLNSRLQRARAAKKGRMTDPVTDLLRMRTKKEHPAMSPAAARRLHRHERHVCRECRNNPARFRYCGEVRADHDHRLCFR